MCAVQLTNQLLTKIDGIDEKSRKQILKRSKQQQVGGQCSPSVCGGLSASLYLCRTRGSGHGWLVTCPCINPGVVPSCAGLACHRCHLIVAPAAATAAAGRWNIQDHQAPGAAQGQGDDAWPPFSGPCGLRGLGCNQAMHGVWPQSRTAMHGNLFQPCAGVALSQDGWMDGQHMTSTATMCHHVAGAGGDEP